MHVFLAAFSSLSHFPTLLPLFPGITSQFNYLIQFLPQSLLLGEPQLRQMSMGTIILQSQTDCKKGRHLCMASKQGCHAQMLRLCTVQLLELYKLMPVSSMAAVINYQRLSGLKQSEFIISQFWSQKSKAGLK